jgi:hypothetical protein
LNVFDIELAFGHFVASVLPPVAVIALPFHAQVGYALVVDAGQALEST